MTTEPNISLEKFRIKEATRINVDLIREREDPASVFLLVGRSGVGKSSLAEHATDETGYSGNSIDPVTTECEVLRNSINGTDYFFIDTPGFDDNVSALTAFGQIAVLLNTIRNNAVLVGLWYVVDNTKRYTPIDTLTIEWIREFCGKPFFPHITIVTTYWSTGQSLQDLEDLLEQRHERWRELLQGAKIYKHGKVYDNSHETPGVIQWNQESRPELSRQIKNMITRHYRGLPATEPRIMDELSRQVGIRDTAAGRVLLRSVSSGFSHSISNGGATPSSQNTSGPPLAGEDRTSVPHAEPRPSSNDQQSSNNSDHRRPTQSSQDPGSRESITEQTTSDNRRRQSRETSFWDNWRFNIGLGGISLEYVSGGIPRGRFSVTPQDIASGVSALHRDSSGIAAITATGATATTASTEAGSNSRPAPVESSSESRGFAGFVDSMTGPPVWMRGKDLNDPYVQDMMRLDSIAMGFGVYD